ncbi:MAG: hypothetical protein RJB41_1161, partial [Actinomycetota bacterium]
MRKAHPTSIPNFSCSGGRIRTGDLPIMSRMLSPTELRRLDYR